MEPKRSLGQNFLISERAVSKIIEAARQFSQTAPGLVEVGPGLGSLTESLLLLNRPLSLLELDRTFADYWRSREQKVIEGDALKLNWIDLNLPEGTVLVSNLPYQISSSLVIERSVQAAGVGKMILMFQKEVAQRLMAQARTPDYGLLTVIAQSFWRLKNLLEAAPQEFYPAPNVASRVVTFEKIDRDWPLSASPQGYLNFVKAGFAQRRKMLFKNLSSGWLSLKEGQNVNGEKLTGAFSQNNLSVQVRAEELDPSTFLRLYLSVIESAVGSHGQR